MRTLAAAFLSLGVATWAAPIEVTIHSEAVGVLSDQLFGQMAERTRVSVGEVGFEAAWQDGAWNPQFVEHALTLRPTWLRYPGGGEADHSDWRWGITHAPGRMPGRVAQDEGDGRFTTFNAGTEEFLALCRTLSSEPVLVVNVLGYQDEPEIGAEVAAAWVEYCNAPNDGSNPRGGVDWAAYRALNGHPEPHGVKMWELGNEIWMPPRGIEPAPYAEIIRPYVTAMLDVDPTIEFTAMGQDARWARASLDAVGERLRWLALHSYSLWSIDQDDVTDEEIWTAAFMGAPEHFYGQTQETWEAIVSAEAEDRISITLNEWNCNAWTTQRQAPEAMREMQGLGSVIYFHQIAPRSEMIGQACFSMIVGTAWANTLMRVEGEEVIPWPTHRYLSGLRQMAGGEILQVEIKNCPEVTLERQIGNIPPQSKPAIDVLAVRVDGTLWISLVNGSAEEQVVDLGGSVVTMPPHSVRLLRR